jgi:hypothetical protein
MHEPLTEAQLLDGDKRTERLTGRDGTLVSWDLSARHNATGRPLSARLELHQLDGLRILGLSGATTALDQNECAGLRVAWLKGRVER